MLPPLLAFLACACARTPAPGYSGPLPSDAGQTLVRGLTGESLVLPGGGAAWTITAFGVVPNPVTDKGPVVLVERDGATRYLPVETDGDAADLYLRVHGRPAEGVSAPTSEAYRAIWKP